MKTIGITELRRRFNTYISQVESGESFIITRYGEPIAVLMSVAHYDVLLGTKHHQAEEETS